MIDIGGGNHKILLGLVLSGADGDYDVYCILCKVQFSVRHGEANNVCKHFGTVKHIGCIVHTNKIPQ